MHASLTGELSGEQAACHSVTVQFALCTGLRSCAFHRAVHALA